MDGIKYIFSYADLLKSCASREVQRNIDLFLYGWKHFFFKVAPCQSEFIAKLHMVTFDKKNRGGENLAHKRSDIFDSLLVIFQTEVNNTYILKSIQMRNIAVPGFPKTINCTCNIDYKENIVHAIQFTAPHTFTQENSANATMPLVMQNYLFNAVLGLHIIKSDAAHK
ncbi:hypothetical protein T4D_9878 [Trichinella pseudospiralis]|uniref:Uncharacterized protein n=1 Tax=Trichinella pseudospiralis TaxID=6337 RepID=A0A0V1FQJ4_TRIPS|nr:hypothetical protein T4D_9878 [Trichinella pseudospiralis]